jgi:leucyl-tRNA synthetase
LQRVSSTSWINIPVEFVSNGILREEMLENCRKIYTHLSYLKIASIDDIKSRLIDQAGSGASPDFSLFHDGSVTLRPEVEKMSKSKYNVVNPDELIGKYGADTFRLYEMFLGPLEQSKPWDTNGIEGVFRFIRKFWRLFHDENNDFLVSDGLPGVAELRALHKTIKKVREDIERLSFNTAVSTFMICVNELTDLKCNKRSILSDLVILMASYAPHIAEELWSQLGNSGSVSMARFPEFKPEFLVENTFEYPVSFNGKTRFKLELPADLSVPEIEKAALEAKESEKWLQGNPPKKVIIVPKKIINIVLQG